MPLTKYKSCSSLLKEHLKQIEVENLLKSLIDQKHISLTQRKIESTKLLALARKQAGSDVTENELMTQLYDSCVIEELGSEYVTFSEKKIETFLQTKNFEIIDKELAKLLIFACDDGLLSLSKLIIRKTDLRCCLQQNRAKVPHLLQSELGQLLLTRDFLVRTISGDHFTIKKTRLKELLKSREAGSTTSSTTARQDVQSQIDKIVQIAINLNLIDPSNLFISRPKFRYILQANTKVAPSIDQHKIGEILGQYGYLNPKAKNPIDTFAFAEAKIRPLLARKMQVTKEENADSQEQRNFNDYVFKKKREELNRLLEILVAENILTREQNRVNKNVVLKIFRGNLKQLPSLTFESLEIDLEEYGFLSQIGSSKKIYTFEMAPILEIIKMKEIKEHPLNGSAKGTRSNDDITETSTSNSVKEQLEMFIGYLAKGGHLSKTKNLVDKSIIFDTLRQYESLFPSLKQQTIGNKLQKNEYLDVPLESGVYHFSPAKIGHIVEQFEQLGKADTDKPATTDNNLSKQEQIDLFVEQLVRKNIVSEVDNVAPLDQIKNALQADNNLWPVLETINLGLQLMKCGYLDYKVRPNTMNFHKHKIKQVAQRIEKQTMAELKQAINKVEENKDIIKALVKADGGANLTDKDQVDYFVDLLVKAKILTKSKNIVNKADVENMFQAYKKLLPFLKIDMGCELMRFGYLDPQETSDIYLFNRKKISTLIDSQESTNNPSNDQQPDQINSNQLQVTKDKKYVEIEQFVYSLIDSNHLSEANRCVRKELVRELFMARNSRLVAVRELGYHLQIFDFIEFKTDVEGTYTFRRRKIHQMITARTHQYADLENRNIVEETINDIDDLSTWTVLRTVSFARAKGDPLGTKSCCVCRKSFRLEINFLEHMQNIHGKDFIIPWQVTVGNTISPIFEMKLQAKSDRSANIVLDLKNIGDKVVAINKIYYIYLNQFVSLAYKATERGTYEVHINREFFITDDEQHSVVVFFEDDRECIEHFYISTPKPLSQRREAAVETQDQQKPVLTRKVFNPIRPKRLKEYKPMKELINVFNHGFKFDPSFGDKETNICKIVREFLCADPDSRLTPDNYVELFSYIVQIADCGQERSMMGYDKQNQRLLSKNGYYALNINDINVLPNELTEGDYIQLRKSNANGRYLDKPSDRVLAMVVKFEGDFIIVEAIEENKRLSTDAEYNLRFKGNRVPIKMEHQALDVMTTQHLSLFMFPDIVPQSDEEQEITEFKWYNRSIRTNPEQVQAITYIVNGFAKPAPYILFGPPGTGKTSTIVEAICQLYTLLDSLKILVTAQSNAACDVIVEKLMQFLPSSDIYRLFAPSWEKKQDKISKEILKISNLASGRHAYPEWRTFNEYRVVVCTLTQAGRLVQANICPDHFTHVFIDECASATEPSALIPIAGLVTSVRQINAHVILAGDIKQLGPVVKSKMAEKMGYGIPLMERLMNRPLYKKDPITNTYNPRVITKLIRSFRSHTKIIEFSNKVFYDNDLLAMAGPAMTDWALGWKLLPNPKFPVVFLPCYGTTQREKNCFSMYNVEEIDRVMNCLRILLTDGVNGKKIRPSDIGIISPYRRQCSKLTLRLQDYRYDGIEVGTVETFQGREKPVIIISTVRSGKSSIGFLNNPKRLNVSITRAQALLILVGNPNMLRIDPVWYDFLDWIISNGGCSDPISLGARPTETLSASLENLLADFQDMDVKPTPNSLKVTESDFV